MVGQLSAVGNLEQFNALAEEFSMFYIFWSDTHRILIRTAPCAAKEDFRLKYIRDSSDSREKRAANMNSSYPISKAGENSEIVSSIDRSLVLVGKFEQKVSLK